MPPRLRPPGADPSNLWGNARGGSDGQGRREVGLDKRRNAGAGAGRHAPLRRRDRLEDLSLAVGPGEVLGVVGPSGCGKSTLLELVAGLQEPDAGTSTVGGSADRRDRCAYMPQRDLLLPWRDAVGNAALALECQGVSAAAARDRARPLFERFGLAEFERRAAGRAVRRHAPARGVHAHAAGRPAGAAAGRAVRRAGRDHPRVDAGVAGRRPGGRAAHGGPGDPRRGGGADAGRPGGGAQPPPRARRGRAGRAPAPRGGARVSDPALLALRERALEALR